jgi:hypothetical protein
VPGARAAFRRGLEHPRLGTPGVVNFVGEPENARRGRFLAGR